MGSAAVSLAAMRTSASRRLDRLRTGPPGGERPPERGGRAVRIAGARQRLAVRETHERLVRRARRLKRASPPTGSPPPGIASSDRRASS
jgi:hypothetical protein